MENKWVISLLSTDFDLHEYRTAAINMLKNEKFVVSAFELPEFPVEPDMHSHDACLKALRRADMAILIIDKRYGGIYFSEKDVSITEKEYLALVESKKPHLIFVSKLTWDERHAYKIALTKSGMSKIEFDKSYACTHVESVKIIDFVENLQHAYSKYGTSNWITQFENIDHLVLCIREKLKSFTHYYCNQIILKQSMRLENRHTSTSLSISLGDVFRRGYYIEPTYFVESGSFQGDGNLDQKIISTLIENSNSILVFGEAGYGKTTILAKCFFSHVERSIIGNDSCMPFYLGLKSKGGNYHFCFKHYINECFEEDLGKEVYPFFDISLVTPYFYLDGFDEIAEKMTAVDVEKISKADMFRHPVLLTCRLQYAYRYINNFDFSDKFGIRIRVDTWSKEKAQSYIENFFIIQGKPEQIPIICALISKNTALDDVLNNPLLITMLLWIIEQKRMVIPVNIQSSVELFSECMNEMANRELSRHLNPALTSEQVVIIWSYAAWLIYYAKIKRAITKMSNLIQSLNTLLPEIPADYNEELFGALFDSSKDDIFGTFHEQFLEYLVANTIYLACTNEKYPFPEFLSYVMRPEINRYFRAKWSEGSDEIKNTIVQNLRQQYTNNLLMNDFEAVSKRVHAIYHITRFPTPSRDDFMNMAFKVENHISVLLSLYFGAIKTGRLDDEQRFFELLRTDKSFSDANSGYHLAYYSDAIMGNQLPFKDDNIVRWDGTLRAFIRHFESQNVEHYYLRRIELITMYQLMANRNQIEPLSEEKLLTIGKFVDNPVDPNKSDFQLKIKLMYDELVVKWAEIAGSSV